MKNMLNTYVEKKGNNQNKTFINMEINNQMVPINQTSDVKTKKGGNANNKNKCINIDPSKLSMLIRNKNNNIIQNRETTLETECESFETKQHEKMNVETVETVETAETKEPDTPQSSSSSNEKSGYYYRHREQKIEYQKKYNRDQGDKIKNYNKDYYQKRREEILEKAKTKITCECGCEVQLFNMNSHKKTKKHARALEQRKKEL
jgi:hypothetical protein